MTDEKKSPEDATDATSTETAADSTQDTAPSAVNSDAKEGVTEASESTGETVKQDEAPALSGDAARIAELEAKLAAAEADAKNNHSRTLRVAADFENHRKRTLREIEDAKRTGSQSALNKLLPVFDNLERATGHIDTTSDAKSIADGLRMVMKQFTEALGKLGIVRVDSLEKPFDPMVHESIQYDYHPTIAAGLITQELQAGYRQGDALLRPALVVVSKGPNPEPTEEAAPETAATSTEAASNADKGDTEAPNDDAN